MNAHPSPLETYRRLAFEASERSHVPFSRQSTAVVLVLGDGRWIPGVRVESATFSLTIPAIQNAVTSAVALAESNVTALIASRPLQPHEISYATRMRGLEDLEQTAPDVLGIVPAGVKVGTQVSPLLALRGGSTGRTVAAASEQLGTTGVLSPADAIALARKMAERAHVPESDFPVGCLLEIEDTGYLPGVNVEHEDWTRILCAERNALGTAVSYGFRNISSIFLTCIREAGCSPCGACRQLLAELAPASTLWMDGGEDPPLPSDPVTLLPGFFAGTRL